MFKKIDDLHIFIYGKNAYDNAKQSAKNCKFFNLDNDEDEFVTTAEEPSCYNCIHRRWTKKSFTCTQGAKFD